jgi:ATP-dependent helicase/nuclease subunit A
VRETEAPTAGGGAGAVSLLTVHAAKGLEFPIVFVPDLGRAEGGERSLVAADARDGLGLKTRIDDGPFADVEPWAFRRVKERNAERARAEEDRLLYVAATRAEERLILSTSLGSRKLTRPWWERVSAALGVGAGASESGVVEPGVLVHGAIRLDKAAAVGTRALFHSVAKDPTLGRGWTDRAGDDARAAAASLIQESERKPPEIDGTLFSATVSGLVAFARCPQEFRLRHLVGAPESFAAAAQADERVAAEAARPGDDDEWGLPLSARAIGRAAHLALERLVPEFDEDVRAAATAALAAECGGAPPAPEDVDKVVRWVEDFAAGEIGREVRALPRDRVRREQALLFPLVPGGRTVVRGQMDLIYEGAAGWTVVDYKAGGADGLREDYQVQMRLYAAGLAAITGTAPARLVLYSLPDAKAVDVPCSPADVASLSSGLVAEFLDRTKRSDYAPREAPPCFGCAYRRRCGFAR